MGLYNHREAYIGRAREHLQKWPFAVIPWDPAWTTVKDTYRVIPAFVRGTRDRAIPLLPIIGTSRKQIKELVLERTDHVLDNWSNLQGNQPLQESKEKL